MFIEVFFAWLFKPQDWNFSAAATGLLRDVASAAGDPSIKAWMDENPGFEFSGLACGYVYREPNGPIRIGLNRSLLEHPESLRARFAAGHELGHVGQLLRGEREAALFTARCYVQEFDASAFAVSAIRNATGSLLDRRYKSINYARVMALEAAFPGVSHAAAAGGLFGGSYLIARKALK